eukprot:TRINITY_DN81474_c0_g1_i1.p1 TRINITY_DN81474_c0_g1~~TRINITY_DN81474_c0_g1_i1.p1  ORF type:complete len:440 (-),score=109.03 TRINITY_DN81474_c0_g1_i1:176-1495(-)
MGTSASASTSAALCCRGPGADDASPKARGADVVASPIHGASDSLPEGRAWAESLARLDCGVAGCLHLEGEDVPLDLGRAHLDVLHMAFERNRTLRSLTLGDLSSDTAKLIAEALQGTVHVAELRLLGRQVNDAVAKLLGIMLRPVWINPPCLTCLVVAHPRRNMLSDKGGVAIAEALEENRSLRTLALFGTQLGDATASALAKSLKRNATLESLAVYGKAMTGDGLDQFAQMLHDGLGVNLQELVVGGTYFGEVEVQAISEAVAGRRQSRPVSSAAGPQKTAPLAKFGLLNAMLGDECLPAFQMLVRQGFLELRLLAGQLSDAAILELSAGLRFAGAQAPRQISIASACAGDASLASFRGFLAEAAGVEEVELAFGNASPEGVAAIPALASKGAVELKDETKEARKRTARLAATNQFADYLEEVLFPRLMLRCEPVLLA